MKIEEFNEIQFFTTVFGGGLVVNDIEVGTIKKLAFGSTIAYCLKLKREEI